MFLAISGMLSTLSEELLFLQWAAVNAQTH